MTKIKGAIFDLDGTLLDSMPMWRDFGACFLRSFGQEPREDLTEVFRTFSREQAAEYYIEHGYISAPAEKIVEAMGDFASSFYKNDVKLKEGAAELLSGLSEAGIPMCIATASDVSDAEVSLTRLGVRHLIKDIFSCTSVGHSKNEPHIYRAALRCLGTEKNETVVFEDALHALTTASNDGFLTAAVFDCDEPRQKRMKELSDFYLPKISDFLKWL